MLVDVVLVADSQVHCSLVERLALFLAVDMTVLFE
jgi:hypothetical protein